MNEKRNTYIYLTKDNIFIYIPKNTIFSVIQKFIKVRQI